MFAGRANILAASVGGTHAGGAGGGCVCVHVCVRASVMAAEAAAVVCMAAGVVVADTTLRCGGGCDEGGGCGEAVAALV